jgi:hypothetical protein
LSYGQILDFDSLVNVNSDFKKLAKSVGDTLDLFNNESILKITLKSDFKNLIKKKYDDEYQPATLSLMFNDTVQVNREIQIKARGNMRKKTCLIPPIKLNFSKKNAFSKQFKSFDKLKMVLDCKKGTSYEQYLLSEYYCYKIQNIINDYSLRARLLQVDYIDHSGKFKDATKYAFIIEDIDQLAERQNAKKIHGVGVRDLRTNISTLTDAYLFQYLIGNTDWSISGNHNIYFVKPNDAQTPRPHIVPYDFDHAGIVNAIYAIPDERLGIESVRERIYRGLCMPETEVIKAKNRFLEKKQEVYDLIENDTLLSKSNKRGTINYLNEFYKILENENQFKRNILDSCR